MPSPIAHLVALAHEVEEADERRRRRRRPRAARRAAPGSRTARRAAGRTRCRTTRTGTRTATSRSPRACSSVSGSILTASTLPSRRSAPPPRARAAPPPRASRRGGSRPRARRRRRSCRRPRRSTGARSSRASSVTTVQPRGPRLITPVGAVRYAPPSISHSASVAKRTSGATASSSSRNAHRPVRADLRPRGDVDGDARAALAREPRREQRRRRRSARAAARSRRCGGRRSRATPGRARPARSVGATPRSEAIERSPSAPTIETTTPVAPGADRPDELDAARRELARDELARRVVAALRDAARVRAERRRPGRDVRRLAARAGPRRARARRRRERAAPRAARSRRASRRRGLRSALLQSSHGRRRQSRSTAFVPHRRRRRRVRRGRGRPPPPRPRAPPPRAAAPSGRPRRVRRGALLPIPTIVPWKATTGAARLRSFLIGGVVGASAAVATARRRRDLDRRRRERRLRPRRARRVRRGAVLPGAAGRRNGLRGLVPARGAARRLRPSVRCSGVSDGTHSSQRGMYQFQSPSSFIVAGSRTPRMTVASISTASASPTPSCFIMISCSVPKIAKTATMMIAALVTVPGGAPDPARDRLLGRRARRRAAP